MIAVEITTTAASPRLSALWPIATGMPSFAQALDDIAFGDVRALHLVAEDVHHLGDARHADAADADEMDRADVGADALHAEQPLVRPVGRGSDRVARGRRRDRRRGRAPVRSTRSARSCAASGRPTASRACRRIGERGRLEAELLHLLGELDRR